MIRARVGQVCPWREASNRGQGNGRSLTFMSLVVSRDYALGNGLGSGNGSGDGEVPGLGDGRGGDVDSY